MARIVTRLFSTLASVVALAAPALAGPGPLGVWVEQSERAAIEVTECAGRLCGRIVWLRDQSDSAGCNVQVFGDVRPIGNNKWDGGWIINPEQDLNKKYDVEITSLGEHKLRVMGYMGVKFLSETRIWTRARADLKRCGTEVAPPPMPEPQLPFTPPPQREAEPRYIEPPSAPPRAEPERKAEPRTVEPPSVRPRPEPERRIAKAPKKDCNISLGGLKMSFPCDDDD